MFNYFIFVFYSVFWPYFMYSMRAIAIDDPVAWPSVKRTTVLTHSPDGATSMRPLLRYCGHLFDVCFKVSYCILIGNCRCMCSFMHVWFDSICFAARRSALARHLLWRRGCVSVTLMYCAQTTESITMRLSPDCSPAILVFPHQM